MKIKIIITIILFTLFLFPSCEWFAVQDTNYLILGGVWELEEIISIDGKPVTEFSKSQIPPFFYRQGLSRRPELAIRQTDTLFYLNNTEGEVLQKLAITEYDFDKRNDRMIMKLENNKFVLSEPFDNSGLFIVTAQANSESELKTTIKGKYKFYGFHPDKWYPVP